MQQGDRNPVRPLGICGRLYSFIASMFMVRRVANTSPDSCSSSSDESESDVEEFWEAEDSTTSEDCNETDQTEANTKSDILKSDERRGALHKGKEKMSQKEANNIREFRQVQELGMYDGISLSLVQEQNKHISSPMYPLSYANGTRAREATRLAMRGSPEMMRRQSMNTQIPKDRSQEVGVKNRKARTISRVFTNINEKSDAFLRSRKEAMRKSYSLGSKMF